MMTLLSRWLVLGVIFQPMIAAVQEGAAAPDLTVLAKHFVELLVQEDYAAAVQTFDTTMTNVMPADKLEQTWKALLSQVGPFQAQTGVRTTQALGYDIVLLTCQFQNTLLDIKVVYDNERRVAGLFFLPTQASVEYQPPGYVDTASFREEDVQIGSGEWVLPGTLTLPKEEGPFPVVVLVHGSGPNDRDETIGQNKPFRDLAWGLASKNVAVLRYEKRTKEHSAKLLALKNTLTVKEETIDDVLAAVALLKKTKPIDPGRIFVLGHSLGGMLIPRIGARDSNIAGFIIMAGTTRSLEDVIVDQFSYIYSLDGSITEAEQKQIGVIKQQAARVKDPALSEATPAAELPFNVSPCYWLDLRGYHPAQAAKELRQPILILQGERDYQVTMDDFQGWKETLANRPLVKFKVYPKLNHLFIAGEGKSKPAEYQIPGHVAVTVISDIADWIRRH